MPFFACCLLSWSALLSAVTTAPQQTPRIDQLLSFKNGRAESSVIRQRSYLRVRDGARFRSLLLVDPAKPRAAQDTVDIEIGSRDAQKLYVQVVIAEQRRFTAPPANEPAPPDVEAFRSAVVKADVSIGLCAKSKCTQYCGKGPRARCCQYSCVVAVP
jgi:hypothetical protein